MRKCSRCGESKPESEFHSSGNGYLRGECKPCKSHLERQRERERVRLFKEWKQTLSCEKCGYSDYRALQFHHPDGNKEANIGSKCSHWSLDRIKKEAVKCLVLCANCHQIEHYTPL